MLTFELNCKYVFKSYFSFQKKKNFLNRNIYLSQKRMYDLMK